MLSNPLSAKVINPNFVFHFSAYMALMFLLKSEEISRMHTRPKKLEVFFRYRMLRMETLLAALGLLVFVTSAEQCQGGSCSSSAGHGLIQRVPSVQRTDTAVENQEESFLNSAGDDATLAQGEGEKSAALVGTPQNSICPADAKDTAVEFWTTYFDSNCQVAEEDCKI